MFNFRPLDREDAVAAAELHARAFPKFFLAQLGERFLTAMYRGFAEIPDAVSVVCELDNQIVGVAVGTIDPRGFFRRLLKDQFFAILLACVLFSVRQPARAPRLLRAIAYRGTVQGAHGALLSSICVSPTESSRGIGSELLSAWVAGVRAAGIGTAYLTTDARDNDRVLKFYEQSGWVYFDDFVTREGREMVCLTVTLHSAGMP